VIAGDILAPEKPVQGQADPGHRPVQIPALMLDRAFFEFIQSRIFYMHVFGPDYIRSIIKMELVIYSIGVYNKQQNGYKTEYHAFPVSLSS
jgi:hypothetical protein